MFDLTNLSTAERRAVEACAVFRDFSGGTLPLAARQDPACGGVQVEKYGGGYCIRYATRSGFLRGVALAATRPGCDVTETKAFARIGYMADASRNAVPTVDTAKRLAAALALMGYDYLQLYTEDTMELPGQPYFGYLRGRYSVAEIREIDTFCTAIGIELVPCIQTLAHLGQIMRYRDYERINDTADILLCGDEETYRLIEDMFRFCADAFTSRRLNIGMDEAHLVGLGKYLDRHGYRTRYEVMSSHLRRVGGLAARYGFSLSMWSDMFFRLVFQGAYEGDMSQVPPALLAAVPQDIRLIYWDYYSTEYQRYDRILKNHRVLSANIDFAGGAWKWGGFAPNNGYAIQTMDASLRACRTNGVQDYLVTGWGDNGGEASQFSNLPALFFTAGRAYGGTGTDEALFRVLFNAPRQAFLAFDAPNDVGGREGPQRNNSSKFFLYDDLLYGMFDEFIDETYLLDMQRNVRRLRRSVREAGEFSYVAETLLRLSEAVLAKTRLSVEIKRCYRARDLAALRACAQAVRRLAKRVRVLYDTFAGQWARENKPFGFEVQTHRFGGLILRLGEVARTLADFADGKSAAIPELEAERLPHGYPESRELSFLMYNDWRQTVSPSVV